VALDFPLNVSVAPDVPAVPEMVKVAAAVRFSVKLCEEVPEVAVTLAVWLVEMVPTVAVNGALEAPAATTTDAGRVTAALPLASVTVTALVAALLNVTVQLDVPGAVTVAGEHDKPLTVGATWAIVIAPFEADPGTARPAGEDTLTPVTWIVAAVSGAPGATTKFAVARLPSAMIVLFMPYVTQIVLPGVLEQVSDLLAAESLVPDVTVTLVMSVAG